MISRKQKQWFKQSEEIITKSIKGFAYAIVLLTVGGGGHQAMAQGQQFESFAEWCENKEGLTNEAQHTVEVLLTQAETEDCQLAQRRLTNFTDLFLWNNGITDITPLSSLTNLTSLGLAENQIKDITPLSSLTNLTSLGLSGNPKLINQTCPIEPQSICIFEPPE